MLKSQHVRQRHIPFNSASLTHLPLLKPFTKFFLKQTNKKENTPKTYNITIFTPSIDFLIFITDPTNSTLGVVIFDSSVHIHSLLSLVISLNSHSLLYNLPLTLRKALPLSSLHNHNSSIITFHQEALPPLFYPLGYCQVHLLSTTLNMSLPIQKTYKGSSMSTGGHSRSFRMWLPNSLYIPPMRHINNAFCSSPIWFIHSPPKPH